MALDKIAWREFPAEMLQAAKTVSPRSSPKRMFSQASGMFPFSKKNKSRNLLLLKELRHEI